MIFRLLLMAAWAATAKGEASPTPLRPTVFGGGPLYSQTAKVMPALRDSGFDTVVLWTLHISATGDLIFNDNEIITNGRYVGDAPWPAAVASLKTAPTSVRRLEFSVGSWGVDDFAAVAALIAAQGTGPNSILYRNFHTLKETLPDLDAIDLDDESKYDEPSTTRFNMMLADLGFHVTLCPYTAADYWQAVYANTNKARPGAIDRVYLQAYAGGTGNRPDIWNANFPGIKADLGLQARFGPTCAAGLDPSAVAKLRTEHEPDIAGVFLWLLDDMLLCAPTYPLAAYAQAIAGP